MNIALMPDVCLSRDLLQSYWHGMLDETKVIEIERHLEECSCCQAAMREVEFGSSADDRNLPLHHLANTPASEWSPRENLFAPAEPPATVGPYSLLRSLGQGGMGTVYLARHNTLQKEVAIKLFPFSTSWDDAGHRFEREVLAVGRLSHPAIVAASDAGNDRGVQYLVMEYVRGLDLSRLMQRVPVLSVADICEIGRQIALGLSHAHANGIVHRDIKPSNIMLDPTGAVKILDFGLVMFDRWDGVASELTTVGQFLGTLDYMSPEQAEKSGAVDYRADLYSLGATLFRLLCGRPPLAASPNLSPLEKLRLLAHHRPPTLRTLREDAPESLVNTIDRLLATDPRNRPASAAHVAEELQPLAIDNNLSKVVHDALQVPEPPESASHSLAPRSRYSQPKLATDSSIPVADIEKVEGIATLSLANNRSGGRWRVAAWVLSAGLPIAFWLGVILQWDTGNGQLIVESEIPNVQLRLVDEKGAEKQLQIETGNQVTKLTGGKYTLEIASASDRVTVDKGTFVLSKGETVIARVRQVQEGQVLGSEPLPTATPNGTPSQQRQARLPVVLGKDIHAWFEIVLTERDPTAWETAVNAVAKLLDADSEKQYREDFYRVCVSSQDIGRKNYSQLVVWPRWKEFQPRLWQDVCQLDLVGQQNEVSRIVSQVGVKDLDYIREQVLELIRKDPSTKDAWTAALVGSKHQTIERQLSCARFLEKISPDLIDFNTMLILTENTNVPMEEEREWQKALILKILEHPKATFSQKVSRLNRLANMPGFLKQAKKDAPEGHVFVTIRNTFNELLSALNEPESLTIRTDDVSSSLLALPIYQFDRGSFDSIPDRARLLRMVHSNEFREFVQGLEVLLRIEKETRSDAAKLRELCKRTKRPILVHPDTYALLSPELPLLKEEISAEALNSLSYHFTLNRIAVLSYLGLTGSETQAFWYGDPVAFGAKLDQLIACDIDRNGTIDENESAPTEIEPMLKRGREVRALLWRWLSAE